VTDEDVAAAFERVAAVVWLAAESPAVRQLLREPTYPADDGPAVLQTAHVTYSDESDQVVVELGLGATRERIATPRLGATGGAGLNRQASPLARGCVPLPPPSACRH
jgi:hypothetical protein